MNEILNIWLHDYHSTHNIAVGQNGLNQKEVRKKKRCFWYIRLTPLTNSKKRWFIAIISSSKLNFSITKQRFLATSRTCERLWKNVKKQFNETKFIFMTLKRSIWTTSYRLKHLTKHQLRITSLSIMWSKMLEWERFIKSWKSSKHEMRKFWLFKYLILHQIK